jgi:hypothetical protein
MFTSLNEQVAAGFKKGNDAIKEAYEAVKDIPIEFSNQFASAKSWVFELPKITTTSRGQRSLDSSMLINFPTMTLEGPAFSSPTAVAPSFSPGQAYPYYPGSNTAPYYSIYGMSGQASYNTSTGSGQASGYANLWAEPTATVTRESLTANASYNTGSPATGATVSVVGTYEKIMANGDQDTWSVNLSLTGGEWSGTVSASSKHGPISVSGNATFSNGKTVSQSFTGDFEIGAQKLHVNYQKMPRDGEDYVTQSASYENKVFDEITLMADYKFDSKIGTASSAGAGYWYDERSYLSAMVGSYAPLVGPATTSGKIVGAIKTSDNQWTLQTSVTITNQNVDDASALMLTDLFNDQIPAQTPLTFHTMFLQSYNSYKNGVFGWFGVTIGY